MLTTDDPRRELLEAIDLLPHRQQHEREAIRAWLDALPAPKAVHIGQGAQWPDLALAAAITLDQQRLTLRAAGATYRMAGATRSFLHQAGGAEGELLAMEGVLKDLDPIVLGSWLEVGPQGVDGGWFLPAPCDLQEVLALLPACEARDGILAWARAQNIDQCLGLRRSVNASAPYTELTLPLADGDALQQVTSLLLLFELLEVPIPSANLRRALLREVDTPLAISAWLLPEGLAQLAVLVQQPSETLLQFGAQLVGAQLGNLQPFLRACDVENAPTMLELARTAENWVAELHVELREHEPPN